MKYLEKFLKGFLKDRRGVTPVVGVILMVAVTVVMGAVIAGFVYGYVGTAEKGPLLGLSVEDNPTGAVSVLIKHTGGEAIDEGDWKLSVTAGKDTSTLFSFASTAATNNVIAEADAELYAGRTLTVGYETLEEAIGTVIAAGWYHMVIIHEPSNSLLMDTNVQVR